MENVVISKTTLRALVDQVLEWYECDGLDLTWEADRKRAIMLDDAITALDMQEELDAKRQQEQDRQRAAWEARKAAEAAEAAKNGKAS
jgi:hypothetical protein